MKTIYFGILMLLSAFFFGSTLIHLYCTEFLRAFGCFCAMFLTVIVLACSTLFDGENEKMKKGGK